MLLCSYIADGVRTRPLCNKILSEIAHHGYCNISAMPDRRDKWLAYKWLKRLSRAGVVLALRIPYCPGSGAKWRTPVVAAMVDPRDPANSPGFMLATIAAKINPWNGFCINTSNYHNQQPPQTWELRRHAELLCRIFGPGTSSERMRQACTHIIYNITARGYAAPPRDNVIMRRVLTYLRERGILERRTVQFCEDIDRKITIYTMSAKTWNKLRQEMMRLTVMPPQCIPRK